MVADHLLPEHQDQARHLLAAAGLHPGNDDLRALTSQYGEVRRKLAALWAVEVGEDEPATIYRPATDEGTPAR